LNRNAWPACLLAVAIRSSLLTLRTVRNARSIAGVGVTIQWSDSRWSGHRTTLSGAGLESKDAHAMIASEIWSDLSNLAGLVLGPIYRMFAWVDRQFDSVITRYILYYVIARLAITALSIAWNILMRSLRWIALEVYLRINRLGSIKAMNRVAELYHLTITTLLAIDTFTLGIWASDPANKFARARDSGPMALIESVRAILQSLLRPSVPAFAAILLILSYTQPDWFAISQLGAILDYADSIDIGRILAWTSIVLLFLLLNRLAQLRARISYEEDRYKKALVLLHRLRSPLQFIEYSSGWNINKLSDDFHRVLPGLWCSAVAGTGSWRVDETGVHLRTSRRLMEQRLASYFALYKSFGEAAAEVEKCVAELTTEELWGAVPALDRRIWLDLGQLHFRERFRWSLPDTAKHLQTRLLDGTALEKQIEKSVERARNQYPDLPSHAAEIVRLADETSLLRLRSRQEDESRSAKRDKLLRRVETDLGECVADLEAEVKDILADAILENVRVDSLIRSLQRYFAPRRRIARVFAGLSRG
jgi:hypothetical protein